MTLQFPLLSTLTNHLTLQYVVKTSFHAFPEAVYQSLLVVTVTPIVVIVPMSKIVQLHHHQLQQNVHTHHTPSVAPLDNGHAFQEISAFTANSGVMEGLIVTISLTKPIAVSQQFHCYKLSMTNQLFIQGTDEGLNLKTYPSSQDIKESEYDSFYLMTCWGKLYVVLNVLKWGRHTVVVL